MNEDVGKNFCGESPPPYELTKQEFSEQDMIKSDKYGTKSYTTAQKMTDPMPASQVDMSDTAKASRQHSSENIEATGESMNRMALEGEAAQKTGEPAIRQKDGNDRTGQGGQSSSSTAPQPTEASMQPPKETLTREQIKELVSQNIEYFFSRENWSRDPYLLSQMDSDQYVPIFILANCSLFKRVTKNHSIILDALKESAFVQLDEENNRVRPNYKRCIVILREIPKLTPVEEIEAMFEGDGCPKSISCEFVHNDVWYVTFESDSDAQNAYKYLRETVKTFKDKPILARIKTKPLSRIGCFSVLPSYGGKDAPGAVVRPKRPVAPGGCSNPYIPPGRPQPTQRLQAGIPNLSSAANVFPPSNIQRMFYAPQNGINSYPTYSMPGSVPVPTAFFYPNPMMQWPAPNLYEINSFVQYSGLSQRATYKPVTNLRFTNNAVSNSNNGNGNSNPNNRRFKPTKQLDQRHMSGGGVVGYNGSGQMRPNHAYMSRPQSALSPHAYNQSTGQAASYTHYSTASHVQPVSLPEGESRSVFSTGNTISNSNCSISTSRSATNSAITEGFAQNEHSLASQSINLNSSCTIQPGTSTSQRNINTVEDDAGAVFNPSKQTSAPPCSISEGSPVNDSSPATSSSSSALSVVNGSSLSISQTSSAQEGISNPPTSHCFPEGSQNFSHAHDNPATTLNRSSNFSDDGVPVRDPQPQRQITRGGRRRLSRRDEELNEPSSGGNRGPQKGASDFSFKNHEAKKPSFELQATSFPPLPAAEELIAVAHEEKLSDPTPASPAWAVESHKFSDVMKGPSKPKPVAGDSDSESPTDNSTQSRERLPTSSQALPPPEPVTIASPHKTSEVSVPSSAGRLERGARVGARGVGRGIPQGLRREFGGRGGFRRDRDGVPLRLSANKENNRPQGRSWHDERPDPDGWIKKTPRDARNHREHRYQYAHSQNNHPQHQRLQSYSDSRSTKPPPMVNGDYSPPSSPKLEIVSHLENSSPTSTAADAKSNGNTETKLPVAEIVTEKEPAANNEGEHKTSWAKMAMASKDQMERLSAKLKEKEEQERLKKVRTAKPQPKIPERASVPARERDGKPFRRGDNFFPKDRKEDRDGDGEGGRDSRSGLPSERSSCLALRTSRESLAPKSPK